MEGRTHLLGFMDDRCVMYPLPALHHLKDYMRERGGPMGRDHPQDALPFMYQEGGDVTFISPSHLEC